MKCSNMKNKNFIITLLKKFFRLEKIVVQLFLSLSLFQSLPLLVTCPWILDPQGYMLSPHDSHWYCLPLPNKLLLILQVPTPKSLRWNKSLAPSLHVAIWTLLPYLSLTMSYTAKQMFISILYMLHITWHIVLIYSFWING